MALLPEVRRVMRGIDPNLPLERPETQRAQFEESISTERLLANLSIFFGLLATLLVAVGLYGTLSYRIRGAPPNSGYGWRWARIPSRFSGWWFARA